MDARPDPDQEQPASPSNSLADEALRALGGSTESGASSDVDAAPATSTASRRRKAGIVAVIVALLAIPGAKFLLPLLAGGAISVVISGGAFVGPYERLPPDVRSAYQERIEAVEPPSFQTWAEAAQATWIESALVGGTPRLDDAELIRRLELQTTALRRADTATCAAFATETPITDATTGRLLHHLRDAELVDWYDIAIRAIEAQVAAVEIPRVISDTEAEALLVRVIEAAPPAESDAMQALFAGTADPALACAGFRALYEGIARLDPVDLAIAARLDVQP